MLASHEGFKVHYQYEKQSLAEVVASGEVKINRQMGIRQVGNLIKSAKALRGSRWASPSQGGLEETSVKSWTDEIEDEL